MIPSRPKPGPHRIEAGLPRLLPALEWARGYHRGFLASDLLAAVIVTIMLIPQSLAYALLAGLPAEMGLYASILPLIAYALFGTSRTLVGGTGGGGITDDGYRRGQGGRSRHHRLRHRGNRHGDDFGADAAGDGTAAVRLSGQLPVPPGGLRLHHRLGHYYRAEPVAPCPGYPRRRRHNCGAVVSASRNLADTNSVTLATGVAAIAFLFWARRGLGPLLLRFGLADGAAAMVAKAGPVFVILATTLASYYWDFGQRGVALVGEVPQGLPTLGVPSFDLQLWSELAVSALLISIIGFVESVSVGKTLAAKRRQRIDPNQELIALGAANIASACLGRFSGDRWLLALGGQF